MNNKTVYASTQPLSVYGTAVPASDFVVIWLSDFVVSTVEVKFVFVSFGIDEKIINPGSYFGETMKWLYEIICFICSGNRCIEVIGAALSMYETMSETKAEADKVRESVVQHQKREVHVTRQRHEASEGRNS